MDPEVWRWSKAQKHLATLDEMFGQLSEMGGPITETIKKRILVRSLPNDFAVIKAMVTSQMGIKLLFAEAKQEVKSA